MTLAKIIERMSEKLLHKLLMRALLTLVSARSVRLLLGNVEINNKMIQFNSHKRSQKP